MALGTEQIPGNGLEAPAEGHFFSSLGTFVERNRTAVLLSPFCLAAFMILAYTQGGEQFRAVIDFLTGSLTQ